MNVMKNETSVNKLTPAESKLIHIKRTSVFTLSKLLKILLSKPCLITLSILFLIATSAIAYLSIKSISFKKEGTRFYANSQYNDALENFKLAHKYWIFRKVNPKFQDWELIEKTEKAQIMVNSEESYNKGIESFNNESYYEAIENFSHMALKDPHYEDAQSKISEIYTILDAKEDEKKAELAKPQASPNLYTPEVQTESYDYHDFYPIILSMEDNKGNIIKLSDFNGYSGNYQFMNINTGSKLKIGDTLFIRITAKDPLGRNIQYRFRSNSDRFNDNYDDFSSSNELSYTISEKDLKSAGEKLRVVVEIRSKKEYYRVGGNYDDLTFMDYVLTP